LAKVKRVHEIAKELGVDGKAIIAKCLAEGIPDVKNHTSVVKLGLEQTIREWFSESHATKTAIETAALVDIGQAKKARRKRGKTETEAPDTATAVATAAPPADAPAIAAPSEAVVPPAAPAPVTGRAHRVAPPTPPPAATAPAALETPALRPGRAHRAPPMATPAVAAPAIAPVEPVAPAAAASVAPAAPPLAPPAPPRPLGPVGKPNVPRRPDVVLPVGPMLGKPTEAVLRGPKVVRIEKADAIERPRPRRTMGGGDTATGAGATIARSRGPVRGRGAGAPGVGAAPEEEGENRPAAAAKRRSLTTRRGRFAEALPSGPSKFSEQDLIELDARLNRATGYLKQRRRDLRKHDTAQAAMPSPAVTGGRVEIDDPVTIKTLSAITGIKSTDIIKYLFNKGVMATINSSIAAEMATEVAMEYNIELVVREQQTTEQQVVAEFESRAETDSRPRPPVVTILGHVDHGKTSLLDRIRKADVAAHEAGGITQHVGAYRVTIKGTDAKEKTVVFLDTPGHEAFTSMRARGASLTDLVALVVAADDGVMPQTVESINHAKAAEVPLIVVLNKIDKPEATEANIRKIYGQLAEHGLNPTEWGGTTEVVKVSATRGDGITELLETLDYQAELLELKADYGGAARGTVIEAQVLSGRGPVARVLVQQGMMRVGDFIVIGRAYGRVRDMTDDRGRNVEEAGPATPVELSGIDEVPDAGDKFYVTDTLQKAEQMAQSYREKERLKQLAAQTKVTLDNFATQLEAGTAKELRVVLKADVQGSIDVLRKSLTDLSTTEVAVKVLHAAVGGITETDVLLADASEAVVIGFHVVAPPMVRDLAEQRHVELRLYRIIYEVTDEVRKAMEGLLEPETKEEQLGEAEVREVFHITKVGSVAGCMVTSGTMSRAAKVRVVRDNVVVSDSRNVESLRRIKEDVKEVRSGFECGIRLAGFDDLKPGDKIVAYNTITVRRKLQP
jgi:translation initiation factor IF-2